MTFEHKSVLLHETVDSLNIRPDGIYVDGKMCIRDRVCSSKMDI